MLVVSALFSVILRIRKEVTMSDEQKSVVEAKEDQMHITSIAKEDMETEEDST